MINKICSMCGKQFKVHNYRENTAKYCSCKCRWESRKGQATWNKGTKGVGVCKPNSGSIKKGEHHSPKTEFKKGNIPWSKGRGNFFKNPLPQWYKRGEVQFKGRDHWNWQGGITPLSDKIRHSQPYIRWRTKNFEHDNYTCRICGMARTILQVDHYPKTFAEILRENNIQSLEDAINCKELWNIGRNRTVCIDCHKKTKTYLKNYKRNKLCLI